MNSRSAPLAESPVASPASKKTRNSEFHAEHLGIRIYKITLASELKPGEYAFFMGTGQGNTMAGAHGGNRSGGSAAGRVWDFSIPE